jgi:hypothetical protein
MEMKDMSDDRMGQMSSEVLEILNEDGGEFALTIRLADGRIVRTKGRAAVSTNGDGTAPQSFDFDSEDFHQEVMRGNIDIRTVCAALARSIKAQGSR